jgi:hypothetical protein
LNQLSFSNLAFVRYYYVKIIHPLIMMAVNTIIVEISVTTIDIASHYIVITKGTVIDAKTKSIVASFANKAAND